jgi:hypothetical protein
MSVMPNNGQAFKPESPYLQFLHKQRYGTVKVK